MPHYRFYRRSPTDPPVGYGGPGLAPVVEATLASDAAAREYVAAVVLAAVETNDRRRVLEVVDVEVWDGVRRVMTVRGRCRAAVTETKTDLSALTAGQGASRSRLTRCPRWRAGPDNKKRSPS